MAAGWLRHLAAEQPKNLAYATTQDSDGIITVGRGDACSTSLYQLSALLLC
jgi:hypothetical protein